MEVLLKAVSSAHLGPSLLGWAGMVCRYKAVGGWWGTCSFLLHSVVGQMVSGLCDIPTPKTEEEELGKVEKLDCLTAHSSRSPELHRNVLRDYLGHIRQSGADCY